MNTYTFSVEQVIEVKANSLEEAHDLLPIYPYSPKPAHYVTDETVELISEAEYRIENIDSPESIASCLNCDARLRANQVDTHDCEGKL